VESWTEAWAKIKEMCQVRQPASENGNYFDQHPH